ncbi:MAG TPA: ribosome-associated translation inhibitor RaiA [Herminiimonas sp.]|jgi:putative sigma-54 modulation protein|nr:ribosome-associated translation inhibitor RaiA [Herminiimonas sp.]
MNILITGHHLDLTPAIREHVENKLERITRHLEKIVEIEVILSLDSTAEKDKRQRAEINLRLKGETLHAESHAENLYAAIDGVIEKLDRQVLKVKGKITDHRHESAKRIEEPASSDSED